MVRRSTRLGGLAHRLLGVAAIALGAGHAARGAAETEAPVRLPAVTVAAAVPLVKIGEFPMLERRFAPAAFAYDHFIYIVGGSPADDLMSATVERFDVRTGKSEIFTRLHIPRFWHKAVVVGDKAYVIGGSVIGGPLPTDPKMAEAMAAHRNGPSLGRGSRTSPILSVEVIDLKTGEVTTGVHLPLPVAAFGCVAVGDQIAVIGGKVPDAGVPDGSGIARTDRLSVFAPEKKQWMLGASLRVGRSDFEALVSGPLVIAPGGYRDGLALDLVDVYDLRTGKWREARPLCRPTSADSAVLLDHYMFLFGDYNKPEELLVYDLAKETSEVFTLGYTAARHTAAVVLDRKIYVIGGRAERGLRALNIIQVFALRKDLKAAGPRPEPAPPDAAHGQGPR